jgi:glyoxylase-like metal-dependent hydrolase (beta-lactamase superfamily II)
MLHCFTVGAFQENCYVWHDAGEIVIVDPGAEASRLIKAIDQLPGKPVCILLTHAHLDHVGAVGALKERYQIPLHGAFEEQALLEQLPMQCQLFGLPPVAAPGLDHDVLDGTVIACGGFSIEAMATPGHSPGGRCYRIGDDVFVGDTIFAGSVGRTDLWGGSWDVLQQSIRTRIFTLPAHVRLHPGHGPSTTVEKEKLTNPFFQ